MKRFFSLYPKLLWNNIALVSALVLAVLPFFIIFAKGKASIIFIAALFYAVYIAYMFIISYYETQEAIKKENNSLLLKIKGSV